MTAFGHSFHVNGDARRRTPGENAPCDFTAPRRDSSRPTIPPNPHDEVLEVLLEPGATSVSTIMRATAQSGGATHRPERFVLKYIVPDLRCPL